jgi:photosystem II stability/assembly factor-like uncharacterized protein
MAHATRKGSLVALILILCAGSVFAGVNQWTTSGPNAPSIANLAISPGNPPVLYLAAGSGLFMSSDTGAAWTALSKPDGTIFSIQVDPTSPSTLYVLAAGIYRSDDGGETWTARNPLANSSPISLSIDSSNSANLYAVADGIHKSTNGGVNWTKVAPESQFGVNALGGYVQSVLCHPDNPSVVYVTAYAAQSVGAEVWRSKDSGTSWSRVDLTSGPANSRYSVFSVYGDPKSADTAYAITDVGLFKTIDGGTTWVNLHKGPLGDTSTLVIDPTNTSRLYLGKSGTTASLLRQPQSGLLSSTDGGQSWTPIGEGLPEAGISSLSIDPAHSSLYAGTGAGVFKSADLGSHWTGPAFIPTGSDVWALATLPQKKNVVLAGTDHGIFRTGDGGRSWEESGLSGFFIRTIAADPQAPSRVFAATSSGVFKSTDFGRSWSTASTGLGLYPQQDAPVTTIAIDPKSSSTLYTYESSSWRFYKTTDSGNHWASTSLETDIYALTVDPIDTSVIYAGRWAADWGYGKDILLKSTDGAGSWAQSQNGLPFPGSVNAIELDPRNHSTLYAGTCDGVYKSTDGAATWSATGAAEGLHCVYGIAFDPRRPATLYAGSYQGGVYRSTDNGATWTPFNSGLTSLNVKSLAIDSTDRFLYAATSDAGVFSYEFPPGPVDLTVGSDDATRLLSIDSQSAGLNLESVTNTGSIAQLGRFGPYSGWVPLATAGSDSVRILWSHDNGSAGLSFVGHSGLTATFHFPPAPGRTPVDLAVSGADSHILWKGADGSAVLQTIDASGNVTKTLSLGPYAGWRATAISDGLDGLTRILWNKDDGTAGISVVSSDGGLTTSRFGPAAGWQASDLAVGGDGLTRLLWSSLDGRVVLGILDATGKLIQYGDIKRSPAGQFPSRIASGLDGLSRILFSGSDGSSRLWLMTPAGALQGEIPLDPGSGLDISEDAIRTFEIEDTADCLTGPPAQATFAPAGLP